MGTALYDYSCAQVANSVTEGRYISVHTCLQPPLDIAFNIHSFGDKRDKLDDNDKEEWSRAGGIDTFLEFRLIGYVSHPGEFAERTVEVSVNPLSSLARFELGRMGLIGDGSYDGTRFLFRLHLPLAETESLLRHVTSRERATEPSRPLEELFQRWNSQRTGWQGEEHRFDLIRKFDEQLTGHNPDLANIRFDLCDMKLGERLAQGTTVYSICRVYA